MEQSSVFNIRHISEQIEVDSCNRDREISQLFYAKLIPDQASMDGII